MGYLLKEALKTLCGVNQWSYAVFWKFGCQNQKLLIWEECYYEPTSCLRLPYISGTCDIQSGVESGDNVQFLVNKMMMENQVNIVGEGLVGRVAFTGNHQWILSENFYGECHPPEVLKEVYLQFTSGMQTVAVIPVLPHGVIQFGSSLTIMENMGFINDVTSLILQLAYIPNVLSSDNYKSEESAPIIGVPVCSGSSIQGESNMTNGWVKAEVIPSNSNLLTNQCEPYIPKFTLNLPSSNSSSIRSTEQIISEDNSQFSLGDDLFDVLGADFKSKLFNSFSSNESSQNTHSWDNSNNFPSKSNEIYCTSQEDSDDHLLEAVVSNVSCGTTLTNLPSSSASDVSLPYGRFGLSDGELFGAPKYFAMAGETSSCLMEGSGTFSQGSSIYGSQISSLTEKGHNNNTENNYNVSTKCSKKPDEIIKPNRKRLKPGENPKPRPKDRQLFQDGVKELREIVPNGAKCSMDVLFERTIEHMFFLQSVAKHADKLKHTGESKIISEDDGFLFKESNFEGGTTWAYELGSQSMLCPIIVKDLNQPRQMLVEMLIENGGLFLEIADIIRGLGLTIIKGVMETRCEKIWAHFVVEANRDVTRVEIFMSLLRLLEQSGKGGIQQPNNILNNSISYVESE